MLIAWSMFLACSAAIVVAGFLLARYGDMISRHTGLGGTVVGLVLVATVTSLPELVTGLSSVAIAKAPDIALGDVMGSCVFNLLLIAVLDFLHRDTPIYLKAGSGHILSAGFSIILLGLIVFHLLAGETLHLPLGHVGMYTPAIIVIYVVAVRSVFIQERRLGNGVLASDSELSLTLHEAVVRYLIAAIAVVVAAIALPFAAIRLAEAMGWNQTFVGTLLVAGATSLPEAASTLGALKARAVDLALGNLLGSNLFNILILAIDDIAYLDGPLLADVSPSHAVSGVSAMIMTGAAVVGLHYRPAMRVFKIAGWVSLGLVLTYVANATVLYLSAH